MLFTKRNWMQLTLFMKNTFCHHPFIFNWFLFSSWMILIALNSQEYLFYFSNLSTQHLKENNTIFEWKISIWIFELSAEMKLLIHNFQRYRQSRFDSCSRRFTWQVNEPLPGSTHNALWVKLGSQSKVLTGLTKCL